MQRTEKFSAFIVSILFTAILASGCGNPASNDDDHDEHSDPHGVQFTMNDEVILTYMDGNSDGRFEVVEEQETSIITVVFLDEEGDEIHGEDLDDEYSLGWEVGNDELVEIEQQADDGRWDFRLVGKSSGTTRVQFKLMHGAHADFQTPGPGESSALEVHVEEQTQ